MTHEEQCPTNEEEERTEERKPADEGEHDFIAKWKGLTRLAREARKEEEEEERIKRNRAFITQITVIICTTFMAWQMISPMRSIVQFIGERNAETQRVSEQELKERVTIAATQKPMTLDEIDRDGYNNLKERCQRTWVRAKDFFDEEKVVRLVGTSESKEDRWLIKLDHDGYNFCKLNRDQDFKKIILFWSKRKK